MAESKLRMDGRFGKKCASSNSQHGESTDLKILDVSAIDFLKDMKTKESMYCLEGNNITR